uniref:GPW/gp25 family protein n=1 Tax=Bartonella sp. TS25HLJMH TaxID=3243576 RepID=UPI0035D106BF
MNSGMDRTTGKPLTGIDHLRQSILDILSTRIGSRVMRRDYGSRVAELIDSPVNNAFSVALYAAVAEALDKWEPRFKLKKIDF